ncbi:MAG: T9SS type A sorting domain-containing protein [Candidatus Eiseniibacteriota bacterium]
MSPSPVFRLLGQNRALIPVVALLLAALAWFALAAASKPTGSNASPGGTMNMGSMSEESMRQANDEWFAKHSPTQLRTTAAPVDSFITGATNFNEDNNSATQIDTARITVGDAILFKYGTGVLHSVVNGTGGADPNMGTLFNQGLTNSTENFTFTFTNQGTVPFFCAVHESFNMKGVVIVNGLAGAGPAASAGIGFVAPPWPNPARSGIHVRFALASAGHARIDVIDAQGRKVANVLDRDLPAGESTASWDGRGSNGHGVPAGVYFLRLSAPNLSDVRRISIER